MAKKVSEFPIPQTFVFENNLLAQLVANPADIEMARRQVTEEIFSDEKARSVWRTIVEMSDAGQEISLETVYPRVDSSHFQTYILPKMGEYRGAMGTVKCLDALLNASAKRVAYFKALDLLTTATGEGSIEDLKRPAEDFLNTLAGYEQPDRDTIDQQDAFNSLGAVLEQNAKDKAAGKRLRVPTSFRTLDWLTYGGFANGNLVVLAARPSVGKTAIALQMARTAAAAGVPALYFSMEMTALELSQRMLFSTRLLDPVDVGGEGRDDDPSLRVCEENVVEGGSHQPFGGGEAGFLDVRALAHEQEHAFLAVFADAGEIHHLPADGGDVELEVARMQDHAFRGPQRDHAGVCDRVVGPDEFGAETAQSDDIAGLHGDELRRAEESVLRELGFEDPEGEAGGVDGHVADFQ